MNFLKWARPALFFAGMCLPGALIAAGPGEGSMTRGAMTIGTCQASSVTAAWRLASLMGEPTVMGNFKWSGPADCELPTSTRLALEVTYGARRGYVIINIDEVPDANSGVGRDMARSPNFDSLICSYSGNKETDCVDAETAKAFWQEGRVTAFEIIWDPAEVAAQREAERRAAEAAAAKEAAEREAALRKQQQAEQAAREKAEADAAARRAAQQQALGGTGSSSTTTASAGGQWESHEQVQRRMDQQAAQQRADLEAQQRRQAEINRQRQAQEDANARAAADVMMMASQADIPEPVQMIGAGWLGGLAATAVLFPQGEDALNRDDSFTNNLLFGPAAMAGLGIGTYFRFANWSPTKLTNVQIMKSRYSLERPQFVVSGNKDEFEGFTISSARYFGQKSSQSGLVLWTDLSSEKADNPIRYAVENGGDTLVYETEKHISYSVGGGFYKEEPSGLVWAVGVMPISAHILDSHGYTRLGFFYPDMDDINDDESFSILDMFGPIRGEIVHDKLTVSAIVDTQTSTFSFGLGYSWR